MTKLGRQDLGQKLWAEDIFKLLYYTVTMMSFCKMQIYKIWKIVQQIAEL